MLKKSIELFTKKKKKRSRSVDQRFLKQRVPENRRFSQRLKRVET